MSGDQRIPVTAGSLEDRRPLDLVIVAGGNGTDRTIVSLPEADPHGFGCDCCAGREPWATILGELFAEMVRGKRPAFDRVLAVMDHSDANRLMAILAEDRLLAARYRRG